MTDQLTAKEAEKAAKRAYIGYRKEVELGLSKQGARSNSRKTVAEIERRFHAYLIATYGDFGEVTNKLIWEYAYQEGHANGYFDIEYRYIEMADLVSKVLENAGLK